MRKLNVFIILTVLTSALFAQTITIKGSVKDAQTGEKLPYANCLLHYTTDTVGIYKGEATDENGNFEFKKVRKRDLILKISFVGYQTYRHEFKRTDFNDKTAIDLKEIALVQDNTLQGVEITAQRKRIVTDGDKLTMNVDYGMANMVTNAFELLKLVPGVMIDNADNIKLNGQGGVRFQYNGRDMKLDWTAVKDMLKGMTTDMIDSYEVLKNPGVKYDAEGTAGIINIKTKKNQTYGLNGSLHVGGSYYEKGRYGGQSSFQLNYVNDKWIINGSVWYYPVSMMYAYGQDSSHRYNYMPTDTVLFRTANDKSQKYYFNSGFSFNASYSLDTVSTVGFYLSLGGADQPKFDYIENTFISHAPSFYSADSMYHRVRSIDQSYKSPYIGLNYVKKLDTADSKFSMDLDYNGRTSDYNNPYTIDYYKGGFLLNENLLRSSGNKRQKNQRSHHVSFRADYFKPFTEDMRFEAGVKTAYSFYDNDNASRMLKGTSYVNDTTETNRFKYFENINSAYASITDKFFQSKLSVRLGLRLEQTNTRGHQLINDTVNSSHYWNLFPNVKIGWKFTDDNEITLNYNYRILRPYADNLNPFLTKNSDYSYSTGNPYLNPQYSHNLSLSHSYKYMLFTTVNYYYSVDNMRNMTVPMTDAYGFTPHALAMISRPVNMGKSWAVTGDVSFDKQFTDAWYFNASLGVFYNNVEVTVDGNNAALDSWAWNFTMYTSLNLPKKWRLSLYYGFAPSSQWGISKTNGWQWLSLDAGKSFFKEKLNVDFSVGWGLNRDDFTETKYQNILLQDWIRADRPVFSLTLRYMFGKTYDNKQIRKRQLENFDSRTDGQRQRR